MAPTSSCRTRITLTTAGKLAAFEFSLLQHRLSTSPDLRFVTNLELSISPSACRLSLRDQLLHTSPPEHITIREMRLVHCATLVRLTAISVCDLRFSLCDRLLSVLSNVCSSSSNHPFNRFSLAQVC